MNRDRIAKLFVALSLGLAIAGHEVGLATQSRTETQRYAGLAAGPYTLCPTVGAQPLGGACFYTLPAEKTVSFTVTDDLTDTPIGGWYRFRHTLGPPAPYAPFCGGASRVAIDPPWFFVDQISLEILLDPTYAVRACALPGVPTTGSISATFEQ
jgi:hypothetical protein